jgi:hypothetical protein
VAFKAETMFFISEKWIIAFETIVSTMETMGFVAITMVSKAKKFVFETEATAFVV